MKRDPRLVRLTINFAILAFIASCLIGIGQRSSTPPLVIGCALAVSLVVTDWLQIVRLPRLLSYLAMLVGALTAMGEFFFVKQIDQLTAVAKLLIYVQVGLMFQAKDRRVFEQWGIFLLLEMIVASLVNDNLLYGVLLIPVLLIGCATLFAFASYLSNLGSGAVGVESNSVYAKLMRWAGREHVLSSGSAVLASAGITMRLSNSVANDEVLSGTYVGIRRVVPFVFSVLVFAASFFYILPRLQSGAYDSVGWHRQAVGFSGEVTLDDVGELLETNAIALKIRFIDVARDRDFQPIEPPYIRGSICHTYMGDGKWKTIDKGMNQTFLKADTPSPLSIKRQMREKSDPIEVVIEEQTPFDDATFGLPPFSKASPSNLQIGSSDTPPELVAYDWRMIDPNRSNRRKLKYRFRTYAFENGRQLRTLPVLSDCLEKVAVDSALKTASSFHLAHLAKIETDIFPKLLALRDRILEKDRSDNPVNKVLMLEDYLAASGEFKYSLAPSPNRQIEVDPIEDFAGNHKSGHCQYFASTMAMFLRSMDIPSRIVLGFRPSDFNGTGMYFLVRQKHAHAWVEAYLQKEDLLAAGIDVPDSVESGAWLRLDPTPPGEGSNAGGSIRSNQGQFESLQQLWQDYVMNVDNSNQPQMLQFFTVEGNGSFAQIWRNIEQTILSLQNNQLVGGLLSPDQWFSWQAAVLLSLLSIVGFVAYKAFEYVMRKFSLFGWKSRELQNGRHVESNFYRRIVRALARLNLRRKPNQTPLEFANDAMQYFAQRPDQFPGAPPELEFLTGIYYRLRFGFDVALQEQDWQRIEQATKTLESLASPKNRSRRGESQLNGHLKPAQEVQN